MKILVISDDAQAKDRLRKALGAHSDNHEIGMVDLRALGDPEDLATGAMDLILVEGPGEGSPAWSQLEKLSAARPHLPVVVATPDQSAEVLKVAMRSGVREVVALEEEAIRDVVLRMLGRIEASSGHSQARVIAFLPAKGSSGSTFLATSLGYSLSSRSGKKVLLIDLNLECGDAVLFASEREPEFTLADICRQIQRLDASFLEACATTKHPNFSILAAPGDPESAILVKPEHIEALISLARDRYDYIILDTDRVMNAVNIKALDLADSIFTVMEETLPYVRDAKRLLNIYHGLGYPREKLRLLVNRHQKGGEISLDDISKALEVPVAQAIPNNYKGVVSSINQGIPLAILSPKDPVVRAIEELADSIGGKPHQEGSWLGRLFHG